MKGQVRYLLRPNCVRGRDPVKSFTIRKPEIGLLICQCGNALIFVCHIGDRMKFAWFMLCIMILCILHTFPIQGQECPLIPGSSCHRDGHFRDHSLLELALAADLAGAFAWSPVL